MGLQVSMKTVPTWFSKPIILPFSIFTSVIILSSLRALNKIYIQMTPNVYFQSTALLCTSNLSTSLLGYLIGISNSICAKPCSSTLPSPIQTMSSGNRPYLSKNSVLLVAQAKMVRFFPNASLPLIPCTSHLYLTS